MKKGALYLIPTAIAENTSQQVVNQQCQEAIKKCTFYLVENIRTARRYISSLKLGITIEELDFKVLDKKTKNTQLTTLFEPLYSGHDIGIMSEAGCPGIADPGAAAVAFAHQKGIKIIPLVGPSSIVMALMSSGFNGQSFVFHGYLPYDKKAKTDKIKEMERTVGKLGQTQIFMDTPYRNNQLLESLLSTCSNQTMLSISRDLTGSKELAITKTIGAWKKEKPDLHKSPTLFCLGNI